ncbi:MAG: NAD-dependent epimerase/dehydratase family protein [Gemmatimonadetes bacterium]|nr:NAD-dependent epimerase/dehydratase family protein [Gemmatimonadota bacterium]
MTSAGTELTRRGFLGVVPGLALSGAMAGPGLRTTWGAVPQTAPGVSLSILVLGGTGFLGPHMIQTALDRGHEVTLFNRGRTNPHLFPDLEKIVGDRGGDLSGLAGRTWDVVIDNSGYVPPTSKRRAPRSETTHTTTSSRPPRTCTGTTTRPV